MARIGRLGKPSGINQGEIPNPASRKDVKNGDRSGDVYENKGEMKTEFDRSGDIYENK